MVSLYLHYIWVFTFLIIAYGLWAQEPELVVQKGHNFEISAVAFSPDGKYILTGGDDKAILKDMNGRELQYFEGHGGTVNLVAFSPSGHQLVTGSNDGSVKLWDLNAHEILTLGEPNDEEVSSLAFSPDGKYLLTTNSLFNTGEVQLWNIKGRMVRKMQFFPQINSICFSPDGKKFLTGGRPFYGNYGQVRVKLWDMKGNEIQSFIGHKSDVTSVAFSPDGKYILSGSEDSTAILWHVDGRKLRSFSGHSSRVAAVAFSPTGKLILTASRGMSLAEIKLWNIDGEELLNLSEDFKLFSPSVVFSPDGKLILAGSGNATKIWDLNGREVSSSSEFSYPVSSFDLSPDGRKLIMSCVAFDSGNNYSQVYLTDLFDRGFQKLSCDIELINAVSFSSDGQKILAGGGAYREKYGSLLVWDGKGKQLQKIKIKGGVINGVMFSRDGNHILTAGEISARMVDLHGNEILHIPGGYDKDSIQRLSVNNAIFSPGGKYIFTGLSSIIFPYEKNTAKLWDLDSQQFQQFIGQNGDVYAMAFSPDGKYILTGGNHEANLWNIDGRKIQNYSTEIKKKDRKKRNFKHYMGKISAVAFSPNGQKIITAGTAMDGDKGIIKMWDLKGRELYSLEGHNDEVNKIAISPDGKFFLSSSWDQTIKMWETQSGEQLITIYPLNGENGNWLKVTPDNYYMGSRGATDFIHFKIQLTTYGFDQFDLRLNRPDKVLETLIPFGADTALIRQYRQAYHKRLEKYGFTEDMLSDDYHVPECAITNSDQLPISTTEEKVQLQIEALDSLRLLDRLNVYVNDVPIYGIPGINLRPESTQKYNTTLTVPLSRGSNKIQVSTLNQGGAESLKATTYITYDAPERKPNLYLLTIGVSDYQAKGKNLQYAAKDALDIAEYYQNTTAFDQTYIKTLTDNQVTKTNILALRDWLETTKVDDQVLIYVSGHGLLNDKYDFYYATHDIDFANPSEKGILYDEIEGLLDGIPARKKLLLMDACHSGEYDKDAAPLSPAQQDSLKQKGISFKGFAKGDEESAPVLGLQNSFELMQQLFADLRRGSGATVITSSSGVQVSFEDEDWANGAFTYAFLYGLKTMKADADQDGQVTASEIQAFVGEYVPRLTEGLQVPTFRRENLEFDFRVW